jgi:Kef-type K+ transport system membrane component KefB/mannitol/fructose-specific phosphotransferase system IIA component
MRSIDRWVLADRAHSGYNGSDAGASPRDHQKTGGGVHGDPILLFMIQVVVVLGLARVLGEIFRYFHQPPLAGEILAGIILGQTILGHLAPGTFEWLFPRDELQEAMFGVTAEIGILFLLLVVGLEVHIGSAWKMRKQTFGVAVTGVLVPLALGTVVAWIMYPQWMEVPAPRLAFALLIGAGVAITAITVVARLLFDLKIIKSDLGLFLISAMAMNELLGWAVLAIVLGLVGAAGEGDAGGGIVGTMVGILVFSAFALTLGRSLTTKALQWIERKELPSPAVPLSFVVCLGLLGGIVTASLQIHPVFGFLLAGMMAGDTEALSEHTRSIIEQMVGAIFVPLFFAEICLRIDFVSDFNPTTVLIVTALSIGGKFVGAWWGANMVKMPALDRLPVGIAHIPGGPMGVLLAGVAFEEAIIGPEMFVALVIASIASALLVGPAFSWTLRRRETHDLVPFFHREHCVWLESDTREEAIEVLAIEASEIPGAPSAEVIRREVFAREEVMGTGVGRGIAIPHARIGGLADPLVVIGASKEGIEWDEIDGRPAHLVFLILTDAEDTETQLELLARIARAYSGAHVTREMIDCEDLDDLWQELLDRLRDAGSEDRGFPQTHSSER